MASNDTASVTIGSPMAPPTSILIESEAGAQKDDSFKFATSYLSELKIMTANFIRIAFQNLCGQFPFLICTFFIGHLPNAAELISGVGLAVAFTEVIIILLYINYIHFIIHNIFIKRLQEQQFQWDFHQQFQH